MSDLLTIAVTISFIGLLAGFLLAFIRLISGPTHVDRIIALDLIGFITISFIAIFTISSRKIAFLDIAITLALVLFVGTVAFAVFMKTRLVNHNKSKEDSSWKS